MAEQTGGLKPFYTLIAVVAVLGVGVLGWLMSQQKHVSLPVDVTVQVADTAGFRGYLLGSDSAKVEITEYADYQCSHCGQFAVVQFPDVRARLIATGKLRWRFRDYPLNGHPLSRLAAHSAACANDQGKFWEQNAAIFDGQGNWAVQSSGADDVFRDYAKANGLDLKAYDACMTSAKYAGRIQADYESGNRLGVNATPTFLIAGRLYPGGLAADDIKHMVDSLSAVAH
ncbi:MAG TPA: thioredoxin domain-containing protein [Gemmatimonadales bacterium]|nr:thioredoxin domain-containing protein [Gemmatimonadales bacterium]